jgi:subtilisin family serine protease
MIITFSARNEGTDANADGVVDNDSISSPGTAKNVLTVGASKNDRQGRYECNTALTYTSHDTTYQSGQTCASMGGQNLLGTPTLGLHRQPEEQRLSIRWLGFPVSNQYKYFGGTSLSNPLVAGAATVVRDFYQKAYGANASAALIKATLISSVVDLLDENNDGVNDNDYPSRTFMGAGGA